MQEQFQESSNRHLSYWLCTTFGLDYVPVWYPRRKKLIADIHALWHLKQEMYYEDKARDDYKRTRTRLAKRHKIRFEHLDFLLGIAATDPSNAWGVLRDFFLQSEPKLTRTSR